ncbi:hypothetical protein ABFV83_01400 [Lacrimispora sp. BS-2]|uniref:Uncharacterized protein n=1 Tax=Lacrimispora sp. BS-2 TaxID=3151850 RepID=A0AAU7PQ07_9FIRM
MRISNSFFPASAPINKKAEIKQKFSDMFQMNRDIIDVAGSVQTSSANKEEPHKKELEDEFDDEKLASHLDDYSGKKISTEKHVNWNSLGLGKLTLQQLNYLKSTYDVENMDPQSCYDLLADLSNMGVLSGYDIVRQYTSFPVPGGRNPVGGGFDGLPLEKLIAMGRAVPLPQGGYEINNTICAGGNVLENQQMSYDSALGRLSSTLNSPTGFDNPSEHQRAIAEERMELYAHEKFLNILKQIKR